MWLGCARAFLQSYTSLPPSCEFSYWTASPQPDGAWFGCCGVHACPCMSLLAWAPPAAANAAAMAAGLHYLTTSMCCFIAGTSSPEKGPRLSSAKIEVFQQAASLIAGMLIVSGKTDINSSGSSIGGQVSAAANTMGLLRAFMLWECYCRLEGWLVLSAMHARQHSE